MPRREELIGVDVDEPVDAVAPDDDEDGNGDGSRLTNGDLARLFHDIGDMLEVKGELRFKTVAYHRAADAIGQSPVDLASAYRDGKAPKVPGVGTAIADKIRELATTGRMAYYEKLRAEIPPTLVELMHIPGLGPRTVKQFHEQLGIETLEDLRRAAEAGTLRDLRGLSKRTEELVLEGIARLDANPRRMLLHRAEATLLGPRRAMWTNRAPMAATPAHMACCRPSTKDCWAAWTRSCACEPLRGAASTALAMPSRAGSAALRGMPSSLPSTELR